LFAREFGYTPEQTINLPFHHRWALIEGHNKAHSEDEPEDEPPRRPSWASEAQPQLASLDELAALGAKVKDHGRSLN
jgi:hypothetical protein